MTAPLQAPQPDGAAADTLRCAGKPSGAGHLRDTWPVHRRQSAQLLGGWLALTVIWIGLGALLTGPLTDSQIVHSDRRLTDWVVAHRTPTWKALLRCSITGRR